MSLNTEFQQQGYYNLPRKNSCEPVLECTCVCDTQQQSKAISCQMLKRTVYEFYSKNEKYRSVVLSGCIVLIVSFHLY